MKIAFLGLGAMGARMAARLIETDYQLNVWNRTPDRAGLLVEKGARLAATPADAVADADIILSMIRDDPASARVWDDEDVGALRGIKAGSVGVEMSTLTPSRVRTLASSLHAAGAGFVDAPLAGSRPQAEAGQLIFFAGGTDADVERIRPVLLAMGSGVHHAGPVGAGMSIKLMVNTLFGAQVAILAEALAIGERHGIGREAALAILGETPVISLAAKAAGASMAAGNFAPMFPIDLVEKDFGYAEQSATDAGAKAPLTKAFHKLYAEACQNGLGELNITGIIRQFDS